MPLADITEKILSDSRDQAREIIMQAEKNAAKVAKEVEEEVATLEKQSAAQLEKTLAENEMRIVASAKQEGKRMMDDMKRELLDSVFAIAFKELAKLPEKDYTPYIEKLARELPKDFDGIIIVPKVRKEETVVALKKAGFTKNISPTGDFTGGFIATEDSFEYNATFEKLFEEKKSSLETEVVHALFGNTSN